MQAKEIKNGTVVNYNGAPVMIQGINVQSPSARGAATLYKFRGRNLVTKQKVDITLKGTESLDEADFLRHAVTLMYTDATDAHFLNSSDYNQYSIALEEITHEMQYITAELEGILALIYNDECVGIQIPTTVELEITQTDPAVKGNSATSRTKPATLATGIQIQVPEYLKQGEIVKVDTRENEFLGRA
ncbi:MAG: elongation factor P [Planctomycetota bacterium]|nr:elongation factor P [Planctomycetota bacterium]